MRVADDRASRSDTLCGMALIGIPRGRSLRWFSPDHIHSPAPRPKQGPTAFSPAVTFAAPLASRAQSAAH